MSTSLQVYFETWFLKLFVIIHSEIKSAVRKRETTAVISY